MKDLRTLFVVNSLSGGGAERSAGIICTQLRNRNIDARIVALNGGNNDAKLSEEIVELNRVWKSGLLGTIKNFLDFSYRVTHINPQVIIVNCELPELYCAFMPRFRSRIIVVEHTTNPWDGRKTLGRITRTLLKIRNSEWVKVNSSPEPIWFGNGTPTVIKNPVEENFQVNDNKIQADIVFIGRLREEKRPELVIQTAIACRLSVAVIGEGNQLDLLSQKFSPHGDLVTFYGFLKNPWARLSKNSLIVVPSKYEGDGLVIVEAIINGFAVVLANNDDLARFGLPSQNYFSTEKDLAKIFVKYKNDGVEPFRVPDSIRLSIKSERNVNLITSSWAKLLLEGKD